MVTSSNKIQFRCPAKLMLAGEYGALVGTPSLAVAIEPFMYLTIETAGSTTISSDLFPNQTFAISDNIDDHKKKMFLKIVSQAMATSDEQLAIKFSSEINPNFGIGSSSALHLLSQCMTSEIKATADWREVHKQIPPLEAKSLIEKAINSQQTIQGVASGYDIKTQFWGNFFPEQSHSASLPNWLRVYVNGQGAPTKQLLTKTKAHYDSNQLWDQIKKTQTIQVSAWQNALKSRGNLRLLIRSMKECVNVLSKSEDYLPAIFSELQKHPAHGISWQLKPAGAGGNDCLIAVSDSTDWNFIDDLLFSAGYQRFKIYQADGLAARKV